MHACSAVWGYVLERFMSIVCRTINDRAHPETNLVNAHSIHVAAQHAAAVWADKLHSSFAVNAHGLELFDTYIASSLRLCNVPELSKPVQFPKLVSRRPYVTRERLTAEQVKEVSALLQGNVLLSGGFHVEELAWLVSSGVTVHGKPRSCIIAHRRRRSHKAQSTCGFRLSPGRVGRVINFLVADLSQSGRAVHAVQLAFVYMHQVYLDPTYQLQYIKLHEAETRFMFAADVGLSVVAFGDESDVSGVTHQIVIDVQL
jgi:hypothetical protein